MLDIESKSLFFCLEKESAKSEASGGLKEMRYVWNTYKILLRCFPSIWWRKDIEPQKGYMFKPYIKYFLSAHIRRQYQKLYSLYLAEVVIQRKNSPKDNLSELREIASDIKDYSETLPSLKNVTALLVAGLSILGTVFSISGIRLPVNETIQALQQDPLLVLTVILAIFLISYYGFLIVFSPFVAAFHFKRFLFKDSNSKDFYFFSRDKAKATQLYNSSVYKLEDHLFELLGGQGQKPKEIPFDIILRISGGALIITFVIFSSYAIFAANLEYNRLVCEEDSRADSLKGILEDCLENGKRTLISYYVIFNILSISLLIFLYVANPIADYNTRVKTRLI